MTRRYTKCLMLLVIGMLSTSVLAETLSVEQGYIRETIPGTKISAAYFTVKNVGKTDRTVVGVSSKFSPRLELHQHLMQDGMMKMRQIDKINVPAGGETVLQPSGLHIMIFELDNPLKSGKTQQLTLHMKNGDMLKIELPVKSLIGQKTKSSGHHHHHH